MTIKFIEALPRFYADVRDSLEQMDEARLIPQLEGLFIAYRCPCGDDYCSSFDVSGATSPLSPEDQKERGIFGGDSIELKNINGQIIVHIDNIDRITEIEVLYRPDIHEELENFGFKRNTNPRLGFPPSL